MPIKEMKAMNKTLLSILVHAKEVNKWVATNLLEVPLQRSILLHLEDQGVFLVNRHQEKGILINL